MSKCLYCRKETFEEQYCKNSLQAVHCPNIQPGTHVPLTNQELSAVLRETPTQEFIHTQQEIKAAARSYPPVKLEYNTPRSRILNEAMEIVHKDRNANYGNPEDNFKQIAELWTAYKKVPFTSADVAIMNALIKIARLSVNPAHHDSAVDIAGYAACLGDIQHNLRASESGSISGCTTGCAQQQNQP